MINIKLFNIIYSLIGLMTFTAPCYASSGSHGKDILHFHSISVEPTIDPNSICRDFQTLDPLQQAICRKSPHATATAMQGVLLSIHECQRQFIGHRWNCSNLNAQIANQHAFMSRGFKETAFAQAMVAAGVLHQVATSCAMGKINTCRCKDELGPHDQESFPWRGCNHDLDYGARFSRKFLSRKDEGIQTIHALMQSHNSKLGRKAVINQKSTKCKCHGMSSSCEVKTCWLAAPDLKAVGDKLKGLYEGAVKVDRTNSVKGKLVPARYIESNTANQKNNGKKWKKYLVYYENSPTYCDDTKEVDLYGTSGRVCNRTTEGVDSCSSLCCGRGFFTVRVHRVEKCNCKFHWCCYVECQRCERDEWVTVCK